MELFSLKFMILDPTTSHEEVSALSLAWMTSHHLHSLFMFALLGRIEMQQIFGDEFPSMVVGSS
jgi:hypothetical protein